MFETLFVFFDQFFARFHLSWFCAVFFMLGIAITLGSGTQICCAATLLFCLVGLLFFTYDMILGKSKIYAYLGLYISFIIGVMVVAFQETRYHKISNQLKKNLSLNATISDVENWDSSRTIATISIAHPLTGRLKCFIKPAMDLKVGDQISLEPIKIIIPDDTSYELYLKKEKLHGSLHINAQNCRLIARPAYSIGRFFSNLKHRIITSLKDKFSNHTASLFFSIFMGIKPIEQQTQHEVKKLFSGWGLSHLLARSGLHLMSIAFLLFLLMTFIPLHVRWKYIFSLFFIVFYTLTTGSSISFSRALITYFLSTLCFVFDASIAALHLFFLTLVIILLYNPYALFFLDFQLSFGFTFLILLLSYLNSTK